MTTPAPADQATATANAPDPKPSSSQSRDHLTQLQDCLDQLATQMFASLYYTSHRSALARIPGQPYQGVDPHPSANSTSAAAAGSPDTANNVRAASEGVAINDEDPFARPDSPTTFSAALVELSRDLVSKTQQIEGLIRGIPGVTRSREAQEARLRELDAELKGAVKDLTRAKEEKEQLVQRVEARLMQISRW